jgi:hypothetical protein
LARPGWVTAMEAVKNAIAICASQQRFAIAE